MKKLFLAFFCCSVLYLSPFAQDTFSIVAVDPETGEVGSAGASCLDEIQFPGSNGAIIISDLLPGRGAIHTQSYWLAQNQMAARARMEERLSPQQIIEWLENNDAQGNPGIRQYGIADLNPISGIARAASFTGTECFDWKGHLNGPNYAIQGNILLGPAIIDSMEARFLRAEGSLAERLMEALQGANVPGADSRCLSEGVSSLSAFVRVAKPNDEADNFYLDLNVPSTPFGLEPIDSLQLLFDHWLDSINMATAVMEIQESSFSIFPNPAKSHLVIENTAGLKGNFMINMFDSLGNEVLQNQLSGGSGQFVFDQNLQSGLYLLKITSTNGKLVHTEKILVTSP